MFSSFPVIFFNSPNIPTVVDWPENAHFPTYHAAGMGMSRMAHGFHIRWHDCERSTRYEVGMDVNFVNTVDLGCKYCRSSGHNGDYSPLN